MPKATSKAKPQPIYEELRTELDAILIELQRENLDIDAALNKYKRGLEIVKQLEAYLESAENTVRKLTQGGVAGSS